ncbi:hypothetical protein Pme01_46450 [Planosporangium mesophilum]|uniref:Uncharacterized protein n=1 Tax=Planosporangium mesophilum TaxID=689768 RepID=A0A8J3TEM2_9ACTN|nr:hypothetical protein Pme01_46450 [Planosporangium mesophilum]
MAAVWKLSHPCSDTGLPSDRRRTAGYERSNRVLEEVRSTLDRLVPVAAKAFAEAV